METFTSIGIMSGSSLDGVDLAYCVFEKMGRKWNAKILYAETIPYSEEWKLILAELPRKSAFELVQYDIDYGILLAELIHEFVGKNKLEPELVASHGHTIFHEPGKGFTFQLGHGQTIAQFTGIKTINDFRIKDIQLGGQGAPLVPIGDQLLFSEYDFCLNIGGIANISYDENGERIAFDICGANQMLNHLSLQLGEAFDENGHFARLGKLNLNLFEQLNNNPYFLNKSPKSLSNQYVQTAFFELLDKSEISVEDKLYTVVKHIAFQVTEATKKFTKGKLLITGGGAHNLFLVDAISMETGKEVIIPAKEMVDFKEALIFAFMGVLRNRGEINCLASATGARIDCSSGVIHHP